MQATEKSDGQSSRGDAVVRMRVEAYDALASAKGAKTVAAAAELHGIARTQLFDYRSGRKSPNLVTAMQMADDLGTTVDRIFEMTRGAQAAAA